MRPPTRPASSKAAVCPPGYNQTGSFDFVEKGRSPHKDAKPRDIKAHISKGNEPNQLILQDLIQDILKIDSFISKRVNVIRISFVLLH